MSLIDFILNLAGLLLWLNWRAMRIDPLQRTSAASLAGTLRRAENAPRRRWHYLVALFVLLLARALFYKYLGPAVDWTPKLHLSPIALSFRSDYLGRMLLFSLLSFLSAWGVLYLWLLLLSVINRSLDDPVQRIIRWQLGRVDRWHALVKLLLPGFAVLLVWLAVHPLLAHWSILPPKRSGLQLLQQAGLVSIGFYFAWKFVIGAILVAYLVTSYIYLGRHPFIDFIIRTGSNLLHGMLGRVLFLLRFGKIDFAPVLGLALVFFLAEMLERLLESLYLNLKL